MADETKGGLFERMAGSFIFQTANSIVLLVKNSFTGSYNIIKENLSFLFQKFWQDPFYGLSEYLLQDLAADKILDQTDIKAIRESFNVIQPVKFILILLFCFKAYVSKLSLTLNVGLGTLNQTLNKRFSPNPPSPESIINAAFRQPKFTGEVRDAMERSGLSKQDIDLLFYANYSSYPEERIRDIYFRTGKSNEWAQERLAELGYVPSKINDIIATWTVIPNLQDIVHFISKEAFEPETYTKLGLDQEFPQEAIEWGKKQGIPEQVVKWIWISHWTELSMSQAFEMYQRDQLTRQELEFIFKVNEIPPFVRERLLNIAYNPITRVDIRRMYEDGILNREQMIQKYRHTGYSPEDAVTLSDWSIAYSQRIKRNKARSAILANYRDMTISKEEANKLLIQAGFKQEDINSYLSLEDYRVEKEFLIAKIDIIKQLRINLLIPENEARKRLLDLALPAKQIDMIMQELQTKVQTTQALPSKTDLVKFFSLGLITEKQWREAMQMLGYKDSDIELYFKLITSKKGSKDEISD